MNIFDDIFEEWMERLESLLPDYLSYHNTAHTRYVVEKSAEIADAENMTANQLMLIKTAALFHDFGFIKGREEHEVASCEMAQSELPSYGFKKDEIHQICGMIMATKIPQTPKNLLDKIVADADLEYLGTEKYTIGTQNLYDELSHFNPMITEKEWLIIQIEFLESHQYHTRYCQQLREPGKQAHLSRLKKDLAYKSHKLI